MRFANTDELEVHGWYKKQLELQTEGLAGNLYKIWPDIKDSAWIGGKREGWERVPYWLDGFIPLAYLLDNDEMKKVVKYYIDAILSYQKTDGWICPCNEEEIKKYDTWAVQLISKVLINYYECSSDERIPVVLYNCIKNYYKLLKEKKIKLFNWGKYRWFETFIAINFLYDLYNEEWLLDLSKILYKQGFDYSKVVKRWKKPKNKWRYDTHVVNVAMMLKEEAITSKMLGNYAKGKAEYLWDILNKYNGTTVGTFTGDECLSGLSPVQGTELCSVVEIMYSYELLYLYTENDKWAKLLELAAFNALPATISDDMWSHQYDQMSNQIACKKLHKSIFRTNNNEAHLFGLEPNFGCCTANFGQGFPKLAISTYIIKENEIINSIPLPINYITDDIKIIVTSEYPFKNNIKYHIESNKNIKFKIRVPNEKIYNIEANNPIDINIDFDNKPVVNKRSNGLYSISNGTIVYSIPIDYTINKIEYSKDGVDRKAPYCDYEYLPNSDWEYSVNISNLYAYENDISNIPFSSKNPPVQLITKVNKIDWGYLKGYDCICSITPKSTKPISDDICIKLNPYGCSKLRVTEFPISK